MKVRVRCPACRVRHDVGAALASSGTACPGCGLQIPFAPTESVRENRKVDACPVCEGPDLYVRKDLNRNLGLTTVVLVALASVFLLWSGRDLAAYGVLGAFALADLVMPPAPEGRHGLLPLPGGVPWLLPAHGPAVRPARGGEAELEYARSLEIGPGVRSGSLPR